MQSPNFSRRKAFSLVEMLIIFVITGILAALLFPAFSAIRARSQQTACLSQLSQLGKAITMYSQDFDGQFPLGGDPIDLHTDVWRSVEGGKFWNEASTLRPLHEVLSSYTQSQSLWHCPADKGFDRVGFARDVSLDGRPSSFEKFHSSYFYRTEFALRRLSPAGLSAWVGYPPYNEVGPDGINLLADGSGQWHSSQGEERFNVLMADGHVKNVPTSTFREEWLLILSEPRQ